MRLKPGIKFGSLVKCLRANGTPDPFYTRIEGMYIEQGTVGVLLSISVHGFEADAWLSDVLIGEIKIPFSLCYLFLLTGESIIDYGT